MLDQVGKFLQTLGKLMILTPIVLVLGVFLLIVVIAIVQSVVH